MENSLPMPQKALLSANLSLGPIHFSVDAEGVLYPFVGDEALYAAFRTPGAGMKRRRTLEVSITSRPIEMDWDSMRLVFNSDPAWRLYETEEGTRIFLRTSRLEGGIEDPLWVACLRADLSEVTIYTGPQMNTLGAAGPGLANPLCYPLDQLLMLHLMPGADTLLLHGACVDFGRGAELFAGCSGAGKTTFSHLVAAHERDAEIITDDRVLLVRTSEGWLAGGTPWPGEGRYAMNTWRPLQSIHLLRQGCVPSFTPLASAEALNRLLPVVSVPFFDQALALQTLDLCGHLVEQVPASEFVFSKSPASVDSAVQQALGSATTHAGAPIPGEGGAVCTK